MFYIENYMFQMSDECRRANQFHLPGLVHPATPVACAATAARYGDGTPTPQQPQAPCCASHRGCRLPAVPRNVKLLAICFVGMGFLLSGTTCLALYFSLGDAPKSDLLITALLLFIIGLMITSLREWLSRAEDELVTDSQPLSDSEIERVAEACGRMSQRRAVPSDQQPPSYQCVTEGMRYDDRESSHDRYPVLRSGCPPSYQDVLDWDRDAPPYDVTLVDELFRVRLDDK